MRSLTFVVTILLVSMPSPAQVAVAIPEHNAPALKRVELLHLNGNGAFVFTLCPTSRDLFLSFDSENNRIVHRWNLDTGRKMNSYSLPKKYRCEAAIVSPDGRVLVMVGYDMLHDALHSTNKVRLVDVQQGKLIKDLNYDITPARVQFSKDGKLILTRQYTEEHGGEHVYDLTGKEHRNIDLKLFDEIEKPTVWEISNRKGGPRPGLFYRDPAGNDLRLYPGPDTYWSDVFRYVVSPDGRFVACSTDTGRLKIWCLPKAKLVFEAQVGKGPFGLMYDPKNQRFLFTEESPDKTTRVKAVEVKTAN